MDFKKIIPLAMAGIAACTATSEAKLQAADTFVDWQTLGNTVDAANKPCFTQRLVITGKKDFARLAFNHFVRPMRPTNPADTLIEIVPGYFHIASPRFAAAAEADTVIVDLVTSGTLSNSVFIPEGFHVVKADGSSRPVYCRAANMTAEPKMWQSPTGHDPMPYGDAVYDRNDELAGAADAVGFYDLVPSFKSVTLTGGGVEKVDNAFSYVDQIEDGKPEWFKAVIKDGKVTVYTAPENRKRAADRLAELNFDAASYVPNAEIVDWPDFAYRGVMIDIARNYQTPGQMARIIRMMRQVGLNVLHFHFADDEAWRLDIPGLPELVGFGGRRGCTTDESEYLAQLFTGDGSTLSVNTSNGYFTARDFIEFLKLAAENNIRVIPEIESPGHARAAIYAMEMRYRNTGDDTFRLIDPEDKSVYTSAQWFHDDVMNPALPGPVRFMTYVASEIQKMYQAAGVELPAIHIGGDEVAMGAWRGSPIAQAYMAEHGITNERGLHLVFIRELVAEFTKLGIPVSGWQEIAVGHDEDFNNAVRSHIYSVNCWSTLGSQSSVTVESARAGYPTVLSNVNHFYLDMCYSSHPYERGLSWGGYVNEFDALHGYASELCPVEPEFAHNIIGVSGHLFSETIRSGSMLESFLLPKMLGLAERAWNAEPTYSDAQFNAAINANHLPRWAAMGYNFHVAQPGIKAVGGKIMMNSQYQGVAGLEIRYTLDGSEPDATSPLYEAPIAVGSINQVRAKAYIDGRASVTSILYL